MSYEIEQDQDKSAEPSTGADIAGSAGVALLGCPFCGCEPTSSVRAGSKVESLEGRNFVAFISCYCGGHAACAWKMGCGETEKHAMHQAAERWNSRKPNAELSGPATDPARITADIPGLLE